MTREHAVPRHDPRTWISEHRGGLILGIVVFVIHAVSPAVYIGDSRLSSIVAWAFLHGGSLDVSSNEVVQKLGTDGIDIVNRGDADLPFFPWPPMLLAIPAVLAWAVLGRTADELSMVAPAQTFLVEIPTASVLIALTTVALRVCLIRLRSPYVTRGVATTCALIFAFGTTAWSVGSRALWQQTVSMFFLTLLLLALQRLHEQPIWSVWVGLTATLAAVTRPTNAAIVALFLGYAMWRSSWPSRALILVGAGATSAVFLAYSYAQYGSVLPPYYTPRRFEEPDAVPFAEGLALNLVSPSRGLLVFCPIVLVGLGCFVVQAWHRRVGGVEVLCAASLPAQLIVIASYGSIGGHAFGPRLMSDVLPFMVVLAAPAVGWLGLAWRRGRSGGHQVLVACVAAALAFGFAVNATGATIKGARCWNVEPQDVDFAPGRIWDWSDPQFLRPYHDLVSGAALVDIVNARCEQIADVTQPDQR